MTDNAALWDRAMRLHELRTPGILVIAALVSALGSWLYFHWRVQPLQWSPPLPPRVRFDEGRRPAIRTPAFVFATRVATFHDELFAYLMYQYYKASKPFKGSRLVLYYADQVPTPEYRVELVLSDDYLASVDRVAVLDQGRNIEGFKWTHCPRAIVDRWQSQTDLFVAAYNLPVRRKMEDLSGVELRRLIRRFIRFKSTTDPRVRRRLEPVPKVLAPTDAQGVAGDIVDVARFYGLPLDIFLGIGAMENNYMNVRGDLKNSIWKRKAAKHDVVLARRKGRVRVLNDSAGRWQITRETLRYVHQLYLKDKRDYTLLPRHLRPSEDLDVSHVDSGVLTTYAGLLLRDLLDHFHGDVALAVGAYNGGPGNPNMHYEEGVRAAAAHARSVLERAAALNGESVMRMRWLEGR